MQTITVKCKLILSNEESEAIDKTMAAFAEACNGAIRVGRQIGSTSNVRIHQHCYQDLRAKHSLSANLAVRAIARAAGILKVKDRRHSKVRPSSIDYDARIFSLRAADWTVSLSTVEGRLKGLVLSLGDYQKDLLRGQHPTSAVVWRNRQGEYYIGIHIEVETPRPALDEEHGWIGVDLGLVNIAVTSDGDRFSGEDIDRIRDRYLRTRASAASKGTRGARKLLQRISGRERRFQADINHQVSKRIVEKARQTGRGIRLEDLSGIRGRVRVCKDQRYRHHSWAFYDLRTKIEYKAAIAGVPVELVDPRYTSRTCTECGHQEKTNRKSQSEFVCQACGHETNADLVGALNISFGGVVNHPGSSAGERPRAAA